MDKNQVIEIAGRYAERVQGLFSTRSIVLYGSYAKGTARDDSDIDIAVIVDNLKTDYLDETARLYKLRREFDDRIEPLLLESGDDRSGFLQEILRTGIRIA